MDSPLPASSSSLCSSTLVMTPAPLPQSHPHPAVRLHPNLHLDLNDLRYGHGHAHTQRGPAPKGALGPHISNLPRRARPGVYAPPPAPATNLQKTPQNRRNTKQPKKKVVVESESESSAPTTASCASVRGAFVPIRLPRLPTVLGQGPGVRRVKRRPPKPLTPAQARARRLCVQALPGAGSESGVVVAFSDAEDEGVDEERAGFDAVVRISISTGAEASIHEAAAAEEDGDDTRPRATTLRLGVPPAAVERDTGVPGLTRAQLRAAGAFALTAASAPDKQLLNGLGDATEKEEEEARTRKEEKRARRVLVCAPRDCAREAFGVGVVLVLGLDKSSPAPLGGDDKEEGGGKDGGAVHRLVMGWHDLPQPKPWRDSPSASSSAAAPPPPPSSVSSPESSASDDDEEEDAEGEEEEVAGGGGGGGGGLRDAWRGLLSRAGMDYLEAVRVRAGDASGEDGGGGGASGQGGGEEDERGGGEEAEDSLPAP
ncbi:hypothetical protein C8R46DRAFT_1048472 [Mycena filopes]|nr:hypothetical protein C8R46DRAFT_1048472 [Mycena filopes]